MLEKTNKFSLNYDIEDLRISVNLYGGFFNNENSQSYTHSHSSFEFHLMLEGESQITTETKTFLLNKAQACIVAPGVKHTCLKGNEKNAKITFCFLFERINNKQKNSLYEKVVDAFENVIDTVKVENAEQYINDTNQILETFYSRKKFSKIRLKMQFCLLILSLARELSPEIISETQDNDVLIVGKTEKSGEKNLRRIMIEDYVNTNFNNDISLKQLSRELFLSEKQTERVFKEEMGIGFSDFVAKVRLDAAIYYLKSTNIKVQDIAAKVGYKSYNGFYRLFYNNIGMSPKDFRKNVCQKTL